jgi:cell division control protein 42
LSYSGTDVVLICFSIVNPTSFRNIIDKWFPEIKEFCPKAKIILVGTKIDLKHDTSIINNLKRNGQVPIDSSKAEKLCKDMQAFKYIGIYY